MHEVKQTSKIVIAWDMYRSGTNVSRIAEYLSISRDTVHRWIREIAKHSGSVEQYLDDYLNAKKGPRTKRVIDPIVKRRIWEIREGNHDCCGQKIQYYLKQSYGMHVGVTTIYKVLAEKYKLRSKWKKNKKPGPVPVAEKAREVIQMDTIDFGDIFAFTAVDIFSKEADVLLRTSLEAKDGEVFVTTCMPRRYQGFSDIIQTDGGSEFKAEFQQSVTKYCNRHRYARSYKKNEQSYIESFNRSLRKECLGWLKYKPEQIPCLTQHINKWLVYYHYKRPHIGLGMIPPLPCVRF